MACNVRYSECKFSFLQTFALVSNIWSTCSFEIILIIFLNLLYFLEK
jgi:hypothetical protein